MINLENEAVMLREEIKNSKFNNEKGGYDKFVTGLTRLRSRDRSVPKGNTMRESTISNERDAQRENYTRMKEQDASYMSSTSRPRNSTSPLSRINKNLRAEKASHFPMADQKYNRNYPAMMLMAHMPE